MGIKTDKERYDEYVAYCKRAGHVQLSFGRYCQIIPHIDELISAAVDGVAIDCAIMILYRDRMNE